MRTLRPDVYCESYVLGKSQNGHFVGYIAAYRLEFPLAGGQFRVTWKNNDEVYQSRALAADNAKSAMHSCLERFCHLVFDEEGLPIPIPEPSSQSIQVYP